VSGLYGPDRSTLVGRATRAVRDSLLQLDAVRDAGLTERVIAGGRP
jgi:hypothetical protein